MDRPILMEKTIHIEISNSRGPIKIEFLNISCVRRDQNLFICRNSIFISVKEGISKIIKARKVIMDLKLSRQISTRNPQESNM
jgi:hypothetical protein